MPLVLSSYKLRFGTQVSVLHTYSTRYSNRILRMASYFGLYDNMHCIKIFIYRVFRGKALTLHV